jgi:hypothetical protein
MVHGKRLECNQCKVRLSKIGQYSITIPKGMAQKLKLEKGMVIYFADRPDCIEMKCRPNLC